MTTTTIKTAGFAYAYQLPGMNNVLQAAGRLIRSAKDTGIVLLLDQRFASRRYTDLFPALAVLSDDPISPAARSNDCQPGANGE